MIQFDQIHHVQRVTITNAKSRIMHTFLIFYCPQLCIQEVAFIQQATFIALPIFILEEFSQFLIRLNDCTNSTPQLEALFKARLRFLQPANMVVGVHTSDIASAQIYSKMQTTKKFKL